MSRDERNAGTGDENMARDRREFGAISGDEFDTDVAEPGTDTASALGAVGTASAAGMASYGGTTAGMPGAIIGGVPDDIEQGLDAETASVDEDIEEFRRIGRPDTVDR